MYGGQEVEPGHRRLVERGVIGMDHRLHRRNLIVPGQGGKARADHRLAQDLPVLLGQIPAGAEPAAGGHDDGCNLAGRVLHRKLPAI